MNRFNRFSVALVAATTALAGCDGVRSPVEPDTSYERPAGNGTLDGIPQNTSTIDSTLTLTEQLLVGSEELAISFFALEPAVGETVEADSLVVTVTDLLETGALLGRNWSTGDFTLSSTTSSTTDTTTQEEPRSREMDFKGKVKTSTEKLTYSDGSSVYRTESTVLEFQGQNRKDPETCKQNEQFKFIGDNPGGATTFTQIVQSVIVCQGSSRQFLMHINLHFTVTPNGKVASNVANIKVKGESGTS